MLDEFVKLFGAEGLDHMIDSSPGLPVVVTTQSEHQVLQHSLDGWLGKLYQIKGGNSLSTREKL